MNKISVLAVAVAALTAASAGRAQDPAKVDSKHYSVVLNNKEVRVLHIHYGPGEKSVMHAHPASVVVFLTDAKTKMTYPNGKSEMVSGKKDQVMYMKATTHQPENVGKRPMDVIQIELKNAPK